jgi:hypothetical protein
VFSCSQLGGLSLTGWFVLPYFILECIFFKCLVYKGLVHPPKKIKKNRSTMVD